MRKPYRRPAPIERPPGCASCNFTGLRSLKRHYLGMRNGGAVELTDRWAAACTCPRGAPMAGSHGSLAAVEKRLADMDGTTRVEIEAPVSTRRPAPASTTKARPHWTEGE